MSSNSTTNPADARPLKPHSQTGPDPQEIQTHQAPAASIPAGTTCELCGMVAEFSHTDQHGVTHYYCSHHAPHTSHQGHSSHHEDGSHDHHGHHNSNMFKQKFWVSLVLTIPVLLYSTMIQDWLNFSMPSFPGSEWVPIIFGSMVFWYGGLVFIRSAFAELRARRPGMMTLISLAIMIAYSYSVINVFFLRGMDFFWDLSTLIVIMLLGHWLEMNSVANAQGALQELAKLLPDTAEVVDDGKSRTVAVSELQVGQVVRVRPGGHIPIDGQVIEGSSSVNEAMVTGESIPVKKSAGDEVIGGTVNNNGVLLITVTKTGGDTTLAGIMKLVAEAQASKSDSQLLADKAAGRLFYIALAAGLITLVAWTLTQPSLDFTFERVVTVFVIACPHALGLAIPLVTSISTSLAANNGLLIRDRKALELAKDLNVILFDKTGTLTEGRLAVVDVWTVKGVDQKSMIAAAAAVELHSEHVIGQAIVDHAKEQDADLPDSGKFMSLPGHGVRAIVKGSKISVGGPTLLSALGINLSAKAKEFSDQAGSEGKTVIYIISDKTILGAMALADAIRAESAEAVSRLQDYGIRVAMLTGDSKAVAQYVANELGISEYFAQVLPEQKSDKVKALQKDGSKVAMVGDGVNDAPALIQADVGIAIGAGTDVAIESADIVLIKSNPLDVAKIINLSKATYHKMQQNLFWGAGYNVAAIPLAAGILAPIGFILPPAIGAVIMSLSTVVVAFNAQLLRRVRL